MGARQSSARATTTRSRDDDEFSGYRFHAVCGANVALSPDRRTAMRRRSFKDGVVFSDRPLRPRETFEIEIVALEREWVGSLRFGLTARNPTGPSPPPPFAVPILTGKPGTYVLAGCAVHGTVDEATTVSWIRDGYALNLDDLGEIKEGTRLGVLYDPFGRLIFTVDGNERGVACEGLPHDVPLFAVLDIYGRAKAVRVMQSRQGRLIGVYTSLRTCFLSSFVAAGLVSTRHTTERC